MSNDSYAQDFYGESSDSFEFQRSAELGAHFAYLQSGPEAAVLASVETGLIDETNGGPTTTIETIEDAFDDSLIARDISIDTLTLEQMATFVLAATQIDSVLNSDIETSADVTALLGDTVNVTFVDGLATTDGMALNGVAVLETDEILVDSGLEFEELRSTLAEEIAETAYQSAFGTASVGDFGEEVLARAEGAQDEDLFETLSTEAAEDTVITEYGQAEASVQEGWTLVSRINDEYSDSFDIVGFEELSSNAYVSAVNEVYTAFETQEYTGDDGIISIDFALGDPMNMFGYDFQDIEDTVTTSDLDFDDDGKEATSVTIVVDNYVNSSYTFDSAENIIISPIAGLTGQVFTHEGVATVTHTATEGTIYTSSSSWTVSGDFTGAIGNPETGRGVGFTVGASYGQTTSNALLANETVTQAYAVNGSEYEENTNVTAGLFAEIADATYTNSYDLYISTSDEDGFENGSTFRVSVSDQQTIDDHLIGVVLSEALTSDLVF